MGEFAHSLANSRTLDWRGQSLLGAAHGLGRIHTKPAALNLWRTGSMTDSNYSVCLALKSVNSPTAQAARSAFNTANTSITS